MSGPFQKSHLSGLFEDTAMHTELEEAWMEKEEAWTTVRGVLAGGSAFRALQKACRKLREVVQATDDRHLDVYAGELEEFTKAGDMRGWYAHLEQRLVEIVG